MTEALYKIHSDTVKLKANELGTACWQAFGVRRLDTSGSSKLAALKLRIPYSPYIMPFKGVLAMAPMGVGSKLRNSKGQLLHQARATSGPSLMFKLPSRLSERTAPQWTYNLNITVHSLHELQHSRYTRALMRYCETPVRLQQTYLSLTLEDKRASAFINNHVLTVLARFPTCTRTPFFIFICL